MKRAQRGFCDFGAAIAWAVIATAIAASAGTALLFWIVPKAWAWLKPWLHLLTA